MALNVGAEIVTLNGVVLEQGTDYTATTNTITLTAGASAGDELNVFAFGNFTVADTVSASAGGTFQNNVTVNGTVTADDVSVSGNLNLSSSNAKLTINSVGAGIDLLSADYGTSYINLGTASDTDKGRIQYLQSTNTLSFKTNNASRMIIDSAGRVTMPYQPMGMAYGAVGQSVVNGNKVIFPSTANIVGGVTYNAGSFTVPVAGKYLFAVNVSTSATSVNAEDGIYLNVYKNGSYYISNGITPLSNFGAVSGEENTFASTYIVEMSANDYVDVRFRDVSSSSATIGAGSLTIYLLG
jgi:hypothetical protein